MRIILRSGNISSLSTNFTNWSNTFKQFVGNLPTNCLTVFGPWCFQGRLAFLDIFSNSVIKQHTASQLYNISMPLFKNYSIGTS